MSTLSPRICPIFVTFPNGEAIDYPQRREAALIQGVVEKKFIVLHCNNGSANFP